MKTDTENPFFSSGRPGRRNSGMALIIILSCLVLITGVIVAFFASVSTELNAAKGYSNGVTSKVLADSAMAAVMGTIKTATSGTGVCWASQPGMIRTYGANGVASTFYKLYSSDQMTVSPPATYTPGDETMGWKTKKALFTDLNAPVVTTGTDGPDLLYPIMDPRAKGVGADPGVEGFSITAPPDFSTTDPAGPLNNEAPMPVRWLYMLKDGSITVPSSGETTANWGGGTGGVAPTKTNPIVGRVAFWTDDETCKLNINTASEPTPWDTPRVVSGTMQTDMKYGAFQPAFREYQRFPGHPFSTALSPVLFPNVDTLSLDQKNFIYGAIPRVAQGGSISATVNTIQLNTATTGVTLDKDRLYASVDEFLFAAGGGSNVSMNSPRQPNQSPTGSIVFTSASLQRLFPFLTASSRAPEVNLFGQPRISIWPVSSSTTSGARTVYDNMAAYCATIGNPATITSGTVRPFYFQRHLPTGTLTNGPCSTTDDFSNPDVSRNSALYTYLYNVTKKGVPGFTEDTQTYRDKWGIDCDQVLTEIFDYIRCTNLHEPDTSLTKYTRWNNTDYGQVAPIKITSPSGTQTKGFGRFHTISQFGIHFICKLDGTPGIMDGYVCKGQAYNADLSAYKLNNNRSQADLDAWKTQWFKDHGYYGKKILQAAILMEPFCPSVGWYQLNQDLFYEVTLSNFSIVVTSATTKQTYQLFNTPANTIFRPGGFSSGYHGRAWGGSQGIRSMISCKGGTNPIFGDYNPLVGPTIMIDAMGGAASMDLTGGDISLRIHNGPGNTPTADNLVQVMNVSFPDEAVPIPELVRDKVVGGVLVHGGVWGWPGSQDYWRTNLPIVQPTPPSTPITVPVTYYDYINNGSGPHPGVGEPAHWWFFENWSDYSSWADPNLGTYPTYMYGRYGASYSGPYYPGNEYPDSKRRWTSEDKSGYASGCVFREEDVVRSMVPKHGDLRLIAALPVVSRDHFVPSHPTRYNDGATHIVHLFTESIGQQARYNFQNEPGINPTQPGSTTSAAQDEQLVNYDYHYSKLPEIVKGAGLIYNQWNDFDKGTAHIRDGAYINKPDEGNEYGRGLYTNNNNTFTQQWPAYYGYSFTEPKEVMFSPNRIVPSAMMFGSLPTGVLRSRDNILSQGSVEAWETLLFHPPTNRSGMDVENNAITHPGWKAPRDHLIADLFWMPVVEPYPISEPFSTAGKINMNYQIVPFTYIRRATAMHGALKGEEVLAIPTTTTTLPGNMSMARICKIVDHETGADATPKDNCTDPMVLQNWNSLVGGGLDDMRKTINIPETLTQFDNLFTSGSIFRCATQICEMHLVRKGENLAQYTTGNFWTGYLATGDNTRERPYANLYAKLTTKSNTYTVHMRVQALQQARAPDASSEKWAQWNEDTDRILSEYRGSALIERYIDASDKDLSKFDETTTAIVRDANGGIVSSGSLDPFYRFRVLSVKKFGP